MEPIALDMLGALRTCSGAQDHGTGKLGRLSKFVSLFITPGLYMRGNFVSFYPTVWSIEFVRSFVRQKMAMIGTSINPLCMYLLLKVTGPRTHDCP